MNIVLAADYGYREQVIVTIKSIMRFHDSVTFYVINKDYPSEWFQEMNEHLGKFHSRIQDCKLIAADYQNFNTYEHISEATFYRYHIPELVAADKVLYLDADLVVTGSLKALYDTDISQVAVAAVPDTLVKYLQHKKEFNAGVLLIHSKKWRELKVLEKALHMHADSQISLPDADQSVLNLLFKDNWLELPIQYNYQVAGYHVALRSSVITSQLPLIVHYTTSMKPWKKNYIPLSFISKMKSLLVGRLFFKEVLTNRLNLPFQEIWDEIETLSWDDVMQVYQQEILK
ncbi:glycosyltransferase family 8 protein [Streptococcus sp. ZJ93]|uniref:glycosyltransferase family 8 protein n=1 Tax=Streptococcus handemini TaxID=3161188 RepID=UPI0032EC6048